MEKASDALEPNETRSSRSWHRHRRADLQQSFGSFQIVSPQPETAGSVSLNSIDLLRSDALNSGARGFFSVTKAFLYCLNSLFVVMKKQRI
ncbi:unnamed protein product [Brassica oleracea var. botrytis]